MNFARTVAKTQNNHRTFYFLDRDTKRDNILHSRKKAGRSIVPHTILHVSMNKARTAVGREGGWRGRQRRAADRGMERGRQTARSETWSRSTTEKRAAAGGLGSACLAIGMLATVPLAHR